MNVALTDELQQLLRSKVENGQFPNEEAVINEALKRFLVEEQLGGSAPTGYATQILAERLPGPFIEDQATPAPIDLPRPAQEIDCSCRRDETRQPNLCPGE